MTNVTLSPKSARATKKYGLLTCIAAYRDHVSGNGANTIGFENGLTTSQADAAINAGREYVTFTTDGDVTKAYQRALDGGVKNMHRIHTSSDGWLEVNADGHVYLLSPDKTLSNRLDSFVTSFQLAALREAGLPESLCK
jgi:hypothetical protein